MDLEQWKQYMRVNGWPRGMEINPWGSCQYDTAFRTYELYFAIKDDLRNIFKNERDLRSAVLEVLGITVKSREQQASTEDHLLQCWRDLSDNVRHFKDVKMILSDTIIEDAQEALNDKVWLSLKMKAELLEKINRASNVHEIIRAFKEGAWDLWAAIPFITSLCFIDYDPLDLPPAPGFGPILNQQAQGANYLVGISAALLVDYGIVPTAETFSDFDT